MSEKVRQRDIYEMSEEEILETIPEGYRENIMKLLESNIQTRVNDLESQIAKDEKILTMNPDHPEKIPIRQTINNNRHSLLPDSLLRARKEILSELCILVNTSINKQSKK